MWVMPGEMWARLERPPQRRRGAATAEHQDEQQQTHSHDHTLLG